MEILNELKPAAMLATVVYSFIGIGVFLISFWLIEKLSPFSIRKEIEDDQNIALAIIIGSVFLALGLIVQAAIRG